MRTIIPILLLVFSVFTLFYCIKKGYSKRDIWAIKFCIVAMSLLVIGDLFG